MYKDFQSLLVKVKEKGKVSVAVVAAHDEAVLGAVKLGMQHGFLQPILIGDEKLIRQLADKIGLPADVQIIDQPDEEKAAWEAILLVRGGQVEALMKGLINTAVFLRAVLKLDTSGARKFLSHLAAFEIPGQPKILFMTDVAFNSYPGLEEKKIILSSAITALHKIGYVRPNVAILGANEVPSPKLPSTMDAQKIVQMGKSGELPAAVIEGPLALDVVSSAECAKHKHIESKIAGDVDLVLVPDIEAGNGIAKAMSHYANGIMAGVVLGAQVPVILNSRSDSVEGKFISIALAMMLK